MGSSNSNFDSDEPIATINVTPLVDVMLVLLVIFMVTTPMLQQGVSVNLPDSSGSTIKQEVNPIMVSIDKSGEVYLDDKEPLTLLELGEKLKSMQEDATEKGITQKLPVYIRADKALPYGDVMKVIGELHSHNIKGVGLVSMKE
jgi:biopolymer transport protein TolR